MPMRAHGGLTLAERRTLDTRAPIVDFSASINPYGPPRSVRRALATLDPSAYPDPDCLDLKERLAAMKGVAPERVVVGNGATEIIHLLGRMAGSGSVAAIFEPTFGEYRAACLLAGLLTVPIAAEAEKDFEWDLDSACVRLQHLRPALVFLCNPNNPTGRYLDRAAVERIAQAAGDGLVVLDDSYAGLADHPWDSSALLARANVVVLHSMTPEFSLAGLRLGYAIAPPHIAAALAEQQPVWSVNAAAQAAGVAALAEADMLTVARAQLKRSRESLARELERQGWRVLRSAANFLLVHTENGAAFRQRLLGEGLCVRDCASFGLPEYVRIGIQRPADCRRLAEAARTIAPSAHERAGPPEARMLPLAGTARGA